MEYSELRWTTARHEAGHAVMRWLRGLPATDVHVNEGYGLCEGTGEKCRGEDAILVTLAGIAAELGYWFPKEDFEQVTGCQDLEEARQILETTPLLRIRLPEKPVPGQTVAVGFFEVEDALRRWFYRACEELQQHCLIVDQIAHLAVDGYLSAADLQTVLDQYAQELENNG
jgi:hypothetical protein